jgi:hypothetical protein
MAQRIANQTSGEDDGWDEVPTESQILFPEDGDEFVGTFVGWTTTSGKGIPQAHFKNVVSRTGEEMGEGFVNCGASLKQQLRDVKTGTDVRIRRTGTQDTGQDTPMVLFKVWTRRA